MNTRDLPLPHQPAHHLSWCRGWGFQTSLEQASSSSQGVLHGPTGDPPSSNRDPPRPAGGTGPALKGGVAVLHDMAVTVADAVAGAYLGEASAGSEGGV